jgi:hypothetical protein
MYKIVLIFPFFLMFKIKNNSYTNQNSSFLCITTSFSESYETYSAVKILRPEEQYLLLVTQKKREKKDDLVDFKQNQFESTGRSCYLDDWVCYLCWFCSCLCLYSAD